MRGCSIYKCPHKQGRPCCADCDEVCLDRCANHPDRCRVVEEARPYTPRTKLSPETRAKIVELYDSGLARIEVAKMLGISVNTVHRLKSKPDGLPAYKVAGCIRFKRAEVEAYVERQAVKPAVKAEPFIKGHFHYVPGMKVV